MLSTQYPNAIVDLGGPGIDIHKRIPAVDLLKPDYSLYPDNEYSLGFTTRGCIRNCPFCIVPRAEGKFRIVQHPREFHDPSKKSIVFLDNNILADKDWFFTVAGWCIENKLKVDFNQGLDIRLLDRECADMLSKLKPLGTWKFALDNINYRDAAEHGIQLMKDAGIRVRSLVNFYVYVDNDEEYDNAVERCRFLKGLNVGAYAMLNLNSEHSQRMKHLKRWTSRKALYWSFDIADYDRQTRK